MYARNLPMIFVLFCLASPAFAQDVEPTALKETILWAKDDIDFPDITIDQKSGRAVISWSVRANTPPRQSFYYAAFNVKKSGKLKLGKATLVAGDGYAGSGAYSKVSKSFVLVYDNEPYGDFDVSNVFTRVISRKGKLQGAAKTHPNINMPNEHAIIVWVPGVNRFLVVFQRMWFAASTFANRGIYLMQLNPQGARVGSITKVRQGMIDGNVNLTLRPIEAVYNKKSKLVHIIFRETTSDESSGNTYRHIMLTFNNAGKLVKERALDSETNVMTSYAGISEMHPNTGNHFIALTRNDQLFLRQIDKNGNLKKETKITAVDADFSDIAYNPDDDLYLIVAEVTGGLMAFYLDRNGNSLATPRMISNDSDAEKQELVYHENLKEFLIVFTIDRSGNDSLIARTLPPRP